MLFSSSIFIFLFFPAVIFTYYFLLFKIRWLQNTFLFFASIIFYGWGEPRYLFIIAGSIIVNYICGLLVARYRTDKVIGKLIMLVMFIINIGVLVFYKYLMFLLTNINLVFKSHIVIPHILLPLGISFFTFQAISYVFDIYRGKSEAQKNPINFGLYLAFFPQLIAGPIVRYNTIATQLIHRKETFDDISKGVVRFIEGLGKKVLLANSLALISDKSFSIQGGDLSISFAWLGAISYALMIYFDFSGYSSMAIGLARMFGFHFEENFNFPYIAKSISEFWRRWHISLGTWFKEYVYFPLGGSRVKSKFRLVMNLFIVWFLTGAWHGANWTFFCWGLFFFVLIASEKFTDSVFKDRFSVLRRINVLILLLFGWVLFRADSLANAYIYMKSMLGLNQNVFLDDLAILYFSENFVFIIAAIILSMPIFEFFKEKIQIENKYIMNFSKVIYTVSILAIFAMSISYTIKGTYSVFIYFNF